MGGNFRESTKITCHVVFDFGWVFKWYDIIASMHAFIASPPNDESAVTRIVSDCATNDAESGITNN